MAEAKKTMTKKIIDTKKTVEVKEEIPKEEINECVDNNISDKKDTKDDTSYIKLMELIKEQASIIEKLKSEKIDNQPRYIDPSTLNRVTVVHLKDYPTRIKLSSGKILKLDSLRQFADLSNDDAKELINNFPKAFENGWITYTGEVGRTILEMNNIVYNQDKIDMIFNYKDCINLDKEGIIDYYNNLMSVQREMFVSWWFNEASKDDARFLNIEVVNGLNKASDGKFSKLIKDKITKAM